MTSAGRVGRAGLRSLRLHRPDVLLALGGVVSVAAAIATAAVGSRVGLAILCIALGLAMAGLALGYRKQSDHRRLLQGLRRTLAAQDRRIELDAHRFRTSLDTLPSDTLRLMRMAEKLAPGTTALPGLGDWAVTPATLLTVIDEIYARSGPVTLLECGSGSSTVFFALALAERGKGGMVVSLESDPAFAEETRGHLRRHHVQDIATVVDAPLVDQVLATGEKRLWYDLAGLPEFGKIDVLFVDGPVGGSSYQARYPAYPVFRTRLSSGALVVLDDTDRPQEQEILERWRREATSGAPLAVERTNVRCTLLRTASDS